MDPIKQEEYMTISELAVMMRCPEYFEPFIAAMGDTGENRRMVDDVLKKMAGTHPSRTDKLAGPKKNRDFLIGAAAYFSNRPTGGEDRAHWSNVYNSENCLRIADRIDAQAATIKALVKALEHYSDVYCEGYCSISDALDHDCGGCPARAALAAAKEPT